MSYPIYGVLDAHMLQRSDEDHQIQYRWIESLRDKTCHCPKYRTMDIRRLLSEEREIWAWLRIASHISIQLDNEGE